MSTLLIHQTDIFHPHNDPDDHWDLACVFALAQARRFELAGVLIDYPPDHQKGDPATHAVEQLAHIHTLPGIPIAIGSRSSMAHRKDTLESLPPCDQAAGSWLLDTLRNAPRPVTIMIVGSCIDVAAAAVRDPELFREKCQAIYLNAGSAFNGDVSGEVEWNVYLNRAAYAAIFDIPCPIYWCPCWHRTNDASVGEYGTWYRFQQGDIMRSLSPQMQNYFLYALTKSNDLQWLRALDRPVDQELLDKHSASFRNMWCTAPIFHSVGLTTTKNGEIVAADKTDDPLFSFEPAQMSCDDNGEVVWEPRASQSASAPERYIFKIHDTARYTDAMITAMKRLLCGGLEAGIVE